MRKLALLLFLSLTLFNICISQELKSPDGKFVMNFSLQENGTPSYTLAYKGNVVIKPGKLGLELKSDEQRSGAVNPKASLFDNFTIADTKTSAFDESWNPVWGEVKTIRNHYNEMAKRLIKKETTGR